MSIKRNVLLLTVLLHVVNTAVARGSTNKLLPGKHYEPKHHAQTEARSSRPFHQKRATGSSDSHDDTEAKVTIEVQKPAEASKRSDIAPIQRNLNEGSEDMATIVIDYEGEEDNEMPDEKRSNEPETSDEKEGFMIVLDHTNRTGMITTDTDSSSLREMSQSFQRMTNKLSSLLGSERTHVQNGYGDKRHHLPRHEEGLGDSLKVHRLPHFEEGLEDDEKRTGIEEKKDSNDQKNNVQSGGLSSNINRLKQKLKNETNQDLAGMVSEEAEESEKSTNDSKDKLKEISTDEDDVEDIRIKDVKPQIHPHKLGLPFANPTPDDTSYGNRDTGQNKMDDAIQNKMGDTIQNKTDSTSHNSKIDGNSHVDNIGKIDKIEKVGHDNKIEEITKELTEEKFNELVDNSVVIKHHEDHGSALSQQNFTILNSSSPILDEDIDETDPARKGRINGKQINRSNKSNVTNEAKANMSKIETRMQEFEKVQDQQVVNPRKAQAMLEYLNKDPLESWIYPQFNNLKELGLNSTMLRNGLVNAGSIDRLKNVMKRALRGDDITLSIVGGSISAGGGLYKDKGSIDGLYYKAVVDWWNKAVGPLTGSEMKVNNAAIGSIGSDYFSFCARNHVSNYSDIVLWELSGNDYNRYLKQPTKGARPLERLSRMMLQLPKRPAILYVNFFKGVDYKRSKKTCPNFEDQGEDIIAHYYKIPSLSWRAMVCEPLIEHDQQFTLRTLFSNDQYHPSLRAHAQMALLLILHLRHVMRSVLQWATTNDGQVPDFDQMYTIPPPLFIGLENPLPLCWTLITPDVNEKIENSLEVKILKQDGFKLDYATNFPIRADKVVCWRAEKPDAKMVVQFKIPDIFEKGKAVERKADVAITTHTRFGGSADIWLDQKTSSTRTIDEGRKTDTGKRTQVDMISKEINSGVHTLNVRTKQKGFCLTSIMVN